MEVLMPTMMVNQEGQEGQNLENEVNPDEFYSAGILPPTGISGYSKKTSPKQENQENEPEVLLPNQ